MKRLIAAQLIVTALLISPFTAFAIESSGNSKQSPATLQKQSREEQSLKNKEEKLQRQEKLEQKVASNAAKMEEVAQKRAGKIASKEAKLEQKIEQTRIKIASREATFKEKIAQFKDKKKAQVAAKVNENLNLINEKRTQTMSNNLTKMTELLVKLQNRVNQASTAGKDVSAANLAINEAQASIDAAKEAVTTQSGQDYNVIVSSETKIGQDAKVTREKLMADLKSTQEKLITARQTISKAISTSVSSIGGQNGTN